MRRAICAKRLPKCRGEAAWEAILPARAPSPPLDRAATVDVAIIGGGFAGLSADRRLTRLAPGTRILVRDAPRIGQGIAGRSSGVMIDLPHEPTPDDCAGASEARDRETIAPNRRAVGFAADAVAERGLPEGALRRDGKVDGAAGACAGPRLSRPS